MKLLLLILFAWAIVNITQGQKSAFEYFKHLPEPLSNPCDSDTLSTKLYKQQLDSVNKFLGADIKARKKEVNDYMKGHKEEMKETMMKNSGLTFTPEQMQKMKQDNKHMTQEQKMKMADEMMKQNANISMNEVQARKTDSEKKDTTALKRWSQAYATENMADQPADQAKIDAEKIKMKSTADLSKELSDLQAKLNGGGGKFTQQLDLLQKDADSAWVELQKRIKPYLDEIARINEANKNEESDKADFEAVKKLQEEIHRLKYHYCEPLTSRYVQILNGLNQYLPRSFADWDHMDELNVEINYRQTGVRMPAEAIGLSSLLAVQNYTLLLGEIQKYRLVAHREIDYRLDIGAEP